MRLFPAIDETALHRVKFQHNVLDRRQKQLPLFGQDKPARMPMKKRCAEILFESADLTADGGLAQAKRFTGMSKRAGVCRGLKDTQLVPIHIPPRTDPSLGRRKYSS